MGATESETPWEVGLIQKNFRPKFFWTKNLFGPKIILDLNFFGPETYWDPKLFDHYFFWQSYFLSCEASLYKQNITGSNGSNNLRFNLFPDLVSHFGLSGRLGVAGGKRVPPAPLGWYFFFILLKITCPCPTP